MQPSDPIGAEQCPRAARARKEGGFEGVYAQLRAMAAACLKNERRGHTLQPTALVHEAFLRLAGRHDLGDQNAMLAAAAAAIRRVLIDHARGRLAKKRSGGRVRQDINTAEAECGADAAQLLCIDEALRRLTELHPRAAQLAELRHFGGVSVEDAARLLGISRKTAAQDWSFARAWLSRELSEAGA